MIRKLLTNKKLLLSLLLFFTFLLNYGQSASSYCFSERIGTYAPLTGATSVSGLGASDDDNISNSIAIPFNFLFGGSGYNQIRVSSNGWLSFGNPSNNATQNNTNSATNASQSKPILFPLWDDLQNRTIPRYVVTGSAPNRIFKLEWFQQEWDYNANSDVISFQVWLYETTNKIEYYYNSGVGNVNNGTLGASIGIYDSNGSYLTLNNIATTPIAQSSIFTTNINVKPASGQVYSFSPPAPVSQAGADQYKNTPFTLAANAPGSGNTGTWSIVSGPNLATSQFASGDTSNPTSTFTPSGSGTWVLRWTISNGSGCNTTDDVVISNCSGNLITNGDFSNSATGNDQAVNWSKATTFGNYVETYPESSYFATGNSIGFTAELDSQSSLRQTVTVVPNVSYTVSFIYARRSDPTAPATVAVDFVVIGGSSPATFTRLTTNSAAPQVGSFTFTPTSSSIAIEFYNSLNGGKTYGTIIDNIVLIPTSQVAPIAGTSGGSFNTSTFCAGVPVQLNVRNVPSSGVFTYSWSGSPGASFSSLTSPSPIVTFSGSGIQEATVVVTTAGGCTSAPSTTYVNVTAAPTITTAATPAVVTAVCPGVSTTTMTYTGTTNSPTSYSIDWATLTDQVSTTFNFLAGGGTLTGISIPAGTAPGNYSGTMTLKNANGCEVTQAITMTINPNLPASVSIAASPLGAICAGTPVTFTATPTNGGTTPTYQWFKGLTAVGTGSTYSSSTLVNGDAIKVVMTSNASPCLTGSPATSNTITMTVNPNLSAVGITPNAAQAI
ncbi:DUF642 domain-containing protein, partial [Flavobacterium sp. ov086]|uniref:DUF642 domain-containing protein n=1 Tax=Flavobacterium sp. ov086 TaxID=1761785 RepID=UPI000B6EA574